MTMSIRNTAPTHVQIQALNDYATDSVDSLLDAQEETKKQYSPKMDFLHKISSYIEVMQQGGISHAKMAEWIAEVYRYSVSIQTIRKFIHENKKYWN